MTSYQPIEGAGGGKGGGGSARTPREEPNTLRSTSKARIIDMIGEGPIVGLVNGLQSAFFDDTPLEDEDGNANFAGVTLHTRDGYPDQDHIAGFPSVENEVDVSVEVTHDVPITRTVDNLDADAVRVKIQIPQLSYQDLETGDLEGYRVAIAIDVRPNGGSWSERRADMIEGKTTSPYQRAYRIDLPGTGPWEVRVRRTSEDADASNINNQTYWAAYTEIIDSKLIYPDSALVALEVDAQQFGSDIPSRSYDMKLRIIEVPSNYDPETRTYSGLWDGSFKLAWSDNPAWCFRDLAMSTRYGAGLESVDKWGLYQIAQYCDELVPNGYGQEEPRFTFNTLFASREEAITTLDTMASIFRGMTYWGTNTVMATADMPADPVKLVTPSNVIEDENSGCFTYSGSALKARHTVALVSWTDPENGYELSVEVVEDKDGIERYGWRQKDVTLVGCTSRGQARRAGLWILYSERAETETVSYKCSVDQADLRPGDIIALSDPSTAGARLGGRLRQTGTERLQLDQRPDEASGGDWYLDVKLPSGGIERRAVASFDGDFVTLANPLSQTPVDGAVWMLSSTEVEPRLFRVLSNKEQEDHTYTITALEHDPNKYARIEQGLQLPEPDNTLIPTGPVTSPYNITIEPSTYIAGGTEHQKITISWTPSDDARVMNYMLDAQGPTDVKYSTRYVGEGTSFDLLDVAPGEWSVRVRGVTGTGTMSPWTVLTTQVTALLLPLPPTTIDLEVGTFSIVLKPQGGRPGQQFEFWRSTAALDESLIESNAVKLGAGNQITDVSLRPDTTYYYYVRGINVYGVSGWYPVQATTENDPAAIMENISGQIKETDLFGDLQSKLGDIAESWVLKVGGDGKVGGIGTAYDPDQNVIDFGILADRFYIADPDNAGADTIPFIFESGALYLKEALIQRLTFSKLTDDQGTFLVENGRIKANYLQVNRAESDNYQSGNSGWALFENGSAELNNAIVRGTVYAQNGEFGGELKAATGTFSGQLTADAVNAIDTINLRGNSITVPVSYYNGNSLNPNEDQWTTIASLNINADGAPIFITGTFSYDCWVPQPGVDPGDYSVSLQCRFITSNGNNDFGFIAQDARFGSMGRASIVGAFSPTWTLNNSSGAVSIQMQIRSSKSGANSISSEIRNRSLFALGVKR